LLKFLQWIKPAKRWVLKTPHHLEFLDLVDRHFGEVRFLWPHRTLFESVPSFMSMVTYNRMMFSNHVDPAEVGKHWVRKTGYMLEKALAFRGRNGNDKKFMDIGYKELVGDSIGVLSRIYETESGLTDDLNEKFRAFEQEHPHRKHGTHNYSLADFDLTEADINRHTSRYGDFLSHLNEGKQTEKIQ